MPIFFRGFECEILIIEYILLKENSGLKRHNQYEKIECCHTFIP